MPGCLSSMFDPTRDGGDSHEGQQHLGADNAVDVEQEIGVHTEFSASYEDAEGTTHSYESSQDVAATVSVQGTLGVAVDTAEGVVTEGGF